MEALFQSVTTDPMYYIGFAVAIVAALAFLVFLRGFLSGSPHIITMAVHEEHLEQYRVRAVWGTLGLFGLLLLWEVIRYIASWFGYPYFNSAGLTLLGAYLIFAIILAIFFAIKDAVTSGH